MGRKSRQFTIFKYSVPAGRHNFLPIPNRSDVPVCIYNLTQYPRLPFCGLIYMYMYNSFIYDVICRIFRCRLNGLHQKLSGEMVFLRANRYRILCDIFHRVKNKNRLQKDRDTEKRKAEIRAAEAKRRLEKNR